MGNNPYGAYQKQQQNVQEDVRLTEAKALMRVAAQMEDAQKEGTPYLEYTAAIKQNQDLWTFFQASLVDSDNKLPEKLKGVLKGLSIYVDRRCIRAIGTHNPKSLGVLININKEIAAGLMESLKAHPPAPEAHVAGMPPAQGAFTSERV